MEQRKLFGTDGIRGRANTWPITGDMAFNFGRAAVHHFQSRRNKTPLIIVGKDTRLSCYMLEQAISAGICSQGGHVILTGPLPAPALAFVTTSMRADAGVMISASHNEYRDNGIKIFDAEGFKLTDEEESQLEELILKPDAMPTKLDAELGRAQRLKGVFGRYLVHTKSALDRSVSLEGIRVVLDCANGAAYKVVPIMFQELGLEVFPLSVEPNGININYDCGALYPQKACEKVKDLRADLGVCLDGDADRIVIIDEEGKVVPGDALLAIFAKFILDKGDIQRGHTIVGTVMSNLGLERYIEKIGLNFDRTDVGDRYIIEQMLKTQSVLGGEPSGHIIFSQNSTTGDGALAALKLLECSLYYKKSVSRLFQEINLFPQIVKNVKVKEKIPFDKVKPLQDKLKKIREKMGGKGRILLRYSGTEPLARIMVEGENEEFIRETCDAIFEIVSSELG